MSGTHMDHHRYPNPREEKKRDKWMCGVRPHVRIGQEDFGLLLVCLGSGGLFVFVWVCVRVEEVVGGWRICNRDDD